MRRAKSGKVRLGNTFNEGEVLLLEIIIGKAPGFVLRDPHFATLAKKVSAMKARVHERVSSAEAVQSAE